jgi:hypothetical protein
MADTAHNAENAIIGGLSLNAWNERWELVVKGFILPQPRLRHYVGLFAAKSGAEFKYIGKAANMRGNGLSGGLARAYVSNASGDNGWGLKKLREQRHEVQAFVIKLPRSSENVATVEALKKAMMKAHDPAWNRSESTVAEARRAALGKSGS